MTDLVYLACPYNHPDRAMRIIRFERANSFASALMRQGIFIFSPISHTHPIAEYGLPPGWDYWELYDREFLRICKALVVLRVDGWEESSGVQAEIRIMRELGKPVLFANFGSSVLDLCKCLKAIGD